MSQVLNLQKYAAQDYNGLVTDRHFNALYQQQPQLISTMIREIFKTNLHGSYSDFVNKFPVKEVVAENNFYEWMLQGQHERNLPLIEYYDYQGNASSEPGKNGSSFFMVFAENYFEPDNVIRGEVEEYALRVLAKKPKGTNVVYEVELVTSDTNLFVDTGELFAGSRWSKDYNLSPSTLSNRGAQPNFTSPFRMKNRVSKARMEYTVPGNMINKGKNEPLEFGFSYQGQKENIWINYQDLVAEMQFQSQCARMMLYGKKNWTDNDAFLNKDQNGKFNLESGAGLFEQIDPSNIHYYTDFDIDWMVDVLVDMGVGKIEQGKRYITLGTGEFGLIQAHKALEAKSAQWTPNFNTDRFFKAGGPQGVQMAKGYGGQFTEYKAVNGVHLRFEIIPFFDDDIRFPTQHPNKGTTESYRYLALDYGGDSGIYQVKVKGVEDTWAYINGLRDPFSPGGKGSPKQVVSRVDGYEIHRMKTTGMLVEDPTKIVDFRYNFVRS